MLSLALLVAVASLPVPFVPQQKDTCGAAALAMVLQYHGRPADHDAIAGALVEPELLGIRGSRLADFARERGMIALVFAGDLELAREHVGKGRPLVIAIGAGRGRFHDVVLVGFDDAARAAIVHDPAVGAARRMPLEQLDRRWRASGRWTLLVQPGEPRVAGEPRPAVAPRADEQQPVATQAPAAEEATRAGGPEEASVPPGYEGLVARAVALGRAERLEDARALLDRAVALEPTRPEAWLERGGLQFLEGRYADAVPDLSRALALREDDYTRDLLASSLQLAGRELEALSAWNPLGKPVLGDVRLRGLEKTRDTVARREVELERGDVLTPGALRAARRRLEETGAFDRVTVRARPSGPGTADLDVALAERHGLGRGPLDVALTSAVNLASQRVRLRYSNIGGSGVAVGASGRWQENRPEAVLQLQWPRPFGVPGSLRLSGFRGEQAYDLGQPFDMRRRGLDVSFRHVLDAGATLSMGVRARQRSFSGLVADARPGLLLGGEAAIEARALESARQRLDLTLRGFGASRSLGSDVGFVQFEGELRHEAVLSRPEGRAVERSVLATRFRAGWGSDGQPVDEMYAPGISPESDLPLRAHRLTRDGIIGANPLGRSVLLLNTEWRQRVLHRPAFDVSAVAFLDAARVSRPPSGSESRLLIDSGAGLRIAIVGGPVLRVDYAWGLSDARRSLFMGLGQAF